MYNYINDDNTIIFDHGHDEPLDPKLLFQVQVQAQAQVQAETY